MAFTGGPNNRPHNPLTFADIDLDAINLNDGAFARRHLSALPTRFTTRAKSGAALWGSSRQIVTRLGWAVGNRKALQIVTDGMKLAPLGRRS